MELIPLSLSLKQKIETKLKEIKTNVTRIDNQIDNDIVKPLKRKIEKLEEEIISSCFELKKQKREWLKQSEQVEFIQFMLNLIQHPKRYCIFVSNEEKEIELLNRYHRLFDSSLLEESHLNCNYFSQDEQKQEEYNVWKVKPIIITREIYRTPRTKGWKLIEDSTLIKNHPFTQMNENLSINLTPFYFSRTLIPCSNREEEMKKRKENEQNKENRENKENEEEKSIYYSCMESIDFKEILEESDQGDAYIFSDGYYESTIIQTDSFSLLWFECNRENEKENNNSNKNVGMTIQNHLEYLLEHQEVWKTNRSNQDNEEEEENEEED